MCTGLCVSDRTGVFSDVLLRMPSLSIHCTKLETRDTEKNTGCHRRKTNTLIPHSHGKSLVTLSVSLFLSHSISFNYIQMSFAGMTIKKDCAAKAFYNPESQNTYFLSLALSFSMCFPKNNKMKAPQLLNLHPSPIGQKPLVHRG